MVWVPESLGISMYFWGTVRIHIHITSSSALEFYENDGLSAKYLPCAQGVFLGTTLLGIPFMGLKQNVVGSLKQIKGMLTSILIL